MRIAEARSPAVVMSPRLTTEMPLGPPMPITEMPSESSPVVTKSPVVLTIESTKVGLTSMASLRAPLVSMSPLVVTMTCKPVWP